jgi:glutamate N-acetyltransferase/amino-acid N-acetyltransferase
MIESVLFTCVRHSIRFNRAHLGNSSSYSVIRNTNPLSFFTQFQRFQSSVSTLKPTPLAKEQAARGPVKHVLPVGFKAAGVRCGIKKKPDVLDFAMIASEVPCNAAAVFTTNAFKAGPVLACQHVLQHAANDVHGVVINSGCANACTGPEGLKHAQETISYAQKFGVKNSLVMSTGVIGPFLPMEKIRRGVELSSAALTTDQSGWEAASRAIMTTDTVPKLHSRTYTIGNGKQFTIAGMCKGSGMIHPNMATMLSVVATDIRIDQKVLQSALSYAADRSFNSVSVDNDTSTNDTFAVLANGQSPDFTVGDTISSTSSPAFTQFQDCLTDFSVELATMLARDGEGATKFVTIQVVGARDYAEAKLVAKSVANSALVKTAMYGQDANWGRVVCAVGYSGANIQPDRVNMWFVDETNDSAEKNLHLLKDGRPFDTNEERATELVRRENITVRVDLGQGAASATVWTCDYSVDYVHINADYRS